MFVNDDELFIVMDLTGAKEIELTDDEIIRMRDVGVSTLLWLGPEWNKLTRDNFRTCNWSQIDNYVAKIQRLGMKALIMCWQAGSKDYSGEYYVKISNNRREFGTFSPWHPGAVEAVYTSLEMVRDHVAGAPVQVVGGWAGSGERILLNVPAYYDEYAVRDFQRHHAGYPDHTKPDGAAWLKARYVQVMTDIQGILTATEWREVWFMLSQYKPLKSNLQCHGCEWIDDYLRAWKRLEPSSINHISYNYFPYGEMIVPIIKAEMDDFGVNEFVGAEYCEGLKSGNGMKAIKRGLRMVLAPKHHYTGHKTIEPWMIHEIDRHVREYRK